MAADEPHNSRVGTVLQGRYRITEQLSSGGMGIVYRGERVALGRVVAIKFLHEAYSSMSDIVKRFEREAKLTSRLEHPNIVSVIDFGVEGTPYIVMDFVSGQTLQDVLADGPLEEQRALSIVRQMLAGLAHAHERGIVHRDIKPANVMLTDVTASGDHVQILDFGLAKLKDVDMTSSSVVVGTPRYMSPEQANGKKADARSDIYATGLVLFELLTGTKVFDAHEPLALLRLHVDQQPDTLAARHPEGKFSAALEAVVKKSLAKDPNARFQTATDMLAALDDLASMPESTPPVAVPATKPKRQRRVSSGRSFAWLLVPAIAFGAWWIAGKPGIADLSERVGGEPDTTKRAAESPASDELERKIRALHISLRESPEDSKLLYQLGTLYFEKDWASEGIAAYRRAVKLDKRLRRDATLNNNAISALGDPDTREQARALLIRSIGKPSLPFLRKAQKSQPKLKREIASLIKRLSD